MKSKEAEAILKPMYDAMESTYDAGDLTKALNDYFHDDGVVVHKGVMVQYGKKSIIENFSKMAEEWGKVKFERKHQKYDGCDRLIFTTFDAVVDSEKKGKQKAKILQIFKKDDDGKWKLYHDEFEILK
ncbi:unnamed protein product [Cylicocyclus nassatus]|uniref:DUF4440 domain-containing protein n=1 Tax=Cylicocyclus nassatus TaxID=53992 RepID=A0AA36GCG7_CYLNA|nr:unnamed protein product [Cylicocyclus nassatus]